MLDSTHSKNSSELFLLAIIVSFGAFFRLYGLGEAAFRADTIQFWHWCNSNLSCVQMLSTWLEMQVDQLPLPLALTKWMLDTFHLPATHFTVRLPNALFGVALIPVMFAAGRRLGDSKVGLAAALLTAVNPFHIQLSGEAYFYSSAILGAGLMLWGLLEASALLSLGRLLSLRFYLVSGGGFFCLAYSQWTALGAAAIFILLLFLLIALAPIPVRARWRSFFSATLLYGIVGFPLLVSSWGLRYLLAKINSPQKALGTKAVEVAGENAWSLVERTVGAFGWGGTPLRLGFTILILVAGIYALFRRYRSSVERWLLPTALLGTVLLFLFSRNAIGAMYESRYLGGLLPVFTLLLALGLCEGPTALRLPASFARGLPLFVVLAAIVNLPAAYACTRLTGKPTPYKGIVRWADENLQQGTPVLVDRWFEAWNELVPYPSSNAVFTFTIPNEPLDQYLRGHWRDSVMDFFARNPDAAYLEIAKTYFDVPTVGFWKWPRENFARHVAITNEAGIKLRQLGFAARGDYYASNTNRLIVEFFYNTREDVIRQRKAAGQRLLSYYGRGWGYEKSGPMAFLRVKTQDFRDWRKLDGEAVLDLINLTDAPISAQLVVRGVAVNGAKRVSAGTVQHTFPAGQLESWNVGALTLNPGINEVAMNDSLWPAGQNPLLVERVELRETPPAAP